MSTNLPESTISDSAGSTKLFFDIYGQAPREFSATDVDASVAFFTEKGFSDEAARSTAMAILMQAKDGSIPVFQLLDTLKGFTSIEISEVTARILNASRQSSSIIGFKSPSVVSKHIARNIMP